MYGSVVYAETVTRFKRYFNIKLYPVVNAIKEIENVAAPVTGRRDDTIRPSMSIVIFFSVIQKILRVFTHYLIFIAEHQKTGSCRMQFAVRPYPHCPKPHQEFFVVKLFPDMIGTGQAHALSVSIYTVRAENGEAHLLHNQHILRPYISVTVHRAKFLFGAVIITFTVAAVSAGHGIAIHVNGFIISLSPRDFYYNNAAAIDLFYAYVVIGKDINVDLIGIIDDIPEFIYELLGIGQVDRVESFVLVLFYSEKDDTAKSICKGRICLPYAVRQPAQCFFCLYTIVFSVFFKIAKIDHRAPPAFLLYTPFYS